MVSEELTLSASARCVTDSASMPLSVSPSLNSVELVLSASDICTSPAALRESSQRNSERRVEFLCELENES